MIYDAVRWTPPLLFTPPLPYFTFNSSSPSPPLHFCSTALPHHSHHSSALSHLHFSLTVTSPTLPYLIFTSPLPPYLTSPHLALTSIIAGQVDLSGQTHCCGQSNASRGEGRALHWHHSLPASIRYVCLRLSFILHLLTILWLLKLLLHLFKMIAVIRNILFIS